MKSLILPLLLLLYSSMEAQSIRKNYKEMTQSEKDLLVSAFYQLRNGPDLVNDLAVFHNNNFMAIHENPPATDVFLAWHRRQILEVEVAMQEINPRASIPFWDWTVDRSTSLTSELWRSDFMGSFNGNWGLIRELGSASLPTSANVSSVQAISNWTTYYPSLENGIVHRGAHNWVNGIMATGASPRDPVFYLHHGMIDKLYQEWVETNNITPSSNLYQRTNMPRYDGTYSFDGVTLPSVNPDDIVDSKSALGVFYAENQLAVLEDYTVTNKYNSTETFYYQYTIRAKDGFTVPSGRKAKMESVRTVVLEPGFQAATGSVFLAKIDEDNNILTEKSNTRVVAEVKENSKEFSPIDVLQNAYMRDHLTASEMINAVTSVYPNPSDGHYVVELAEFACTSGCTIDIADVNGAVVQRNTVPEASVRYPLDIHNFPSGVYIMNVGRMDGEVLFTNRLIKH